MREGLNRGYLSGLPSSLTEGNKTVINRQDEKKVDNKMAPDTLGKY